MFPRSFFAGRYFAPRYWPSNGAVVVTPQEPGGVFRRGDAERGFVREDAARGFGRGDGERAFGRGDTSRVFRRGDSERGFTRPQ